jgi:hypothetical protein
MGVDDYDPYAWNASTFLDGASISFVALWRFFHWHNWDRSFLFFDLKLTLYTILIPQLMLAKVLQIY